MLADTPTGEILKVREVTRTISCQRLDSDEFDFGRRRTLSPFEGAEEGGVFTKLACSQVSQPVLLSHHSIFLRLIDHDEKAVPRCASPLCIKG